MRWDVDPSLGLLAIVDEWLEDIAGTLDPAGRTRKLYRMHFAAHLEPFFGEPAGITPEEIAAYGRARLKAVKRETVKKERSTLRGFLVWCVERGYVDSVPDFPPLPRRAQGTPYRVRRRGKATPLEIEEALELIGRLPRWSTPRREGTSRFPVRARFLVMLETSLRPATLDALSVPEHYSRGATRLIIADEIDKARYGRELPLTPEARAALDSVCPERGLIFGRHDYRWHLRRAALKALPAERARTFTAYDLRHLRLTELAETGNLTGAAHMGGHKRVTTTAIYVRPGLRAAERALTSAAQTRASTFEPPTGIRSTMRNRNALCEGEDSNLHGSYPASTSRQREKTNAEPAGLVNSLGDEAVALLRAASADEPVEYSRLTAFARAAIARSEHGRLALGVLDGGTFGPRRALELAQLVVAEGAIANDAAEGEGGGS